MSAFIDNLRGWIDDDCGRAGPVISDAADALERVERDQEEMLAIMSLRWPPGQDMPVLTSWPDQLRALFDAFARRLEEEYERSREELLRQMTLANAARIRAFDYQRALEEIAQGGGYCGTIASRALKAGESVTPPDFGDLIGKLETLARSSPYPASDGVWNAVEIVRRHIGPSTAMRSDEGENSV